MMKPVTCHDYLKTRFEYDESAGLFGVSLEAVSRVTEMMDEVVKIHFLKM